MKKVILSLLAGGFVCYLFADFTFAQFIEKEKAYKTAKVFLKIEQLRQEKKTDKLVKEGKKQLKLITKHQTENVKPVKGEKGQILAWVTELEPEGYIVTSADDRINPVIAYSFKGSFPFDDSKYNVLLHMVQWDMEARLKAIQLESPEILSFSETNSQRWMEYCSQEILLVEMSASSSQTQWPDPLQYDGYEGWITTQWYQGYPFNKYCPKDPRNNYRCRVGCTATAAAQIINYWKYPGMVDFEDKSWLLGGDSYSSRSFNLYPTEIMTIKIDDDANALDFPTFDQLNSVLTTINYNGDEDEEAYLCFAVGIKHHMGYAWDGSAASLKSSAYTKGFDYGSAEKHYIWLKTRAIENIKKGWPLQLAVTAWHGFGGHSVVVDGYKSTGEFHVNCGWGGAGDWWYSLPDIDTNDAPYRPYQPPHYTAIDEVVLDICPYQGWNQWGADERNSFSSVYTYPEEEPDIKWERTVPDTFNHYSFYYMVVGTGGRIYASLNPDDLGGDEHPYICIIDQYGNMEKTLGPITDSDTKITYLAQNKKGEIFFGIKKVGIKTSIFRINPQTDAINEIFSETGTDSGAMEQPIKIDSDSNIYFILDKSSGGAFCSISRTGSENWRDDSFSSQTTFSDSAATIDVARNRVYLNYYDLSTQKSYLRCYDRTNGSVFVSRQEKWHSMKHDVRRGHQVFSCMQENT